MEVLQTMRIQKALLLFGLAAAFTFTACKKDDGPTNPNEIVKDFYFQAVLDGDTVTYQDGLDDYGSIVGDFYGLQAANGWEYAPFTCIASNDAVANANPTTLAKSGAVAIISRPPAQLASLQAYDSMVAIRSYSIDSASVGGFVSFFDANGTEWTSNGPQTNGNVTVTEYTSKTDNSFSPPTHRIMAATFQCTLYNALGDAKSLTSGKIRGRLIRW
jgi:hypothetical protein